MAVEREQGESDLLQRAVHLDRAALGEVYDRFSPELYRYARRLLGEAGLAEDCVAETFSQFLGALQAGGGPRTHLRAYLYRTAHNWVTDYYRRQVYLPLDDDLGGPSESEPHERVGDQMEQEAVRTALVRLTPDQRQVVVLKFVEGWKDDDIARSLGKQVGAVRALQQRALASLERMLERGGGQNDG
jgi:RNA polymerase sigma-70 factor, ECF subfamily